MRREILRLPFRQSGALSADFWPPDPDGHNAGAARRPRERHAGELIDRLELAITCHRPGLHDSVGTGSVAGASLGNNAASRAAPGWAAIGADVGPSPSRS